MTEKAKQTTRRNVGEIIQRGRIYYIRYYDSRGRRRLETTKGTKHEDAEKLHAFPEPSQRQPLVGCSGC